MSAEQTIKDQLDRIAELRTVYGAPGDHGYDTPAGDALYRLYAIAFTLSVLLPEIAADARDAARYRWLRERDLETIDKGGVFIGAVPENLVLNLEEADQIIDAAREAEARAEIAK
ncbi:hypothetical protein [Blastochloris tepida]|uniref:Uncharacterized protein n=1 Tax=Blastochloris tepida TaxID=2233851 RepID=A0A348FYK4_9HYPH|nr:hypothetical protein [Blastochloris tepida]BBF92387.1 hypothetical protein BLTE_10720 [Blastochloris tepida]